MIIGIGTDIINITRIEKILAKYPDRFLERLLTSMELQEINAYQNSKRKITAIAKRFAAKEAVSKAFGTGISSIIGFQDMEITHDKKGKPEVVLSKRAENYLASLGSHDMLKNINISLSDDYPWAQAFVVINAHKEQRKY